jgi:3-hydroxyisobutyrate dehydrogenase-like beta-hydroxyacid dehydrogenase
VSETIGFIGLGQMGLPMAQNLMKAGYSLRIYNRSQDKAEPLVEQGAILADHPSDVIESGGIAITMLSNDQAVQEVTLGEHGLLNRLEKEGVHISMSTISPETARYLAEQHEQQGSYYVAAPVLGRPDAAAAAKLWIMMSGPPTAKQRVVPLLNAMGQGVRDFGEEPGAANVVKLAANFMIGAAIEAMAEAFTLAQKNGVERTQVYEFLSQTLFACPIYQNYGRMVAEENYQPVGAKPTLIRKDIGLVLQTARSSLVPMPFAGLVHDRLTAIVAKRGDTQDWAGFAHEVSESAAVAKEIS